VDDTVSKEMSLQNHSANMLVDADPTVELPRVWSASLVNARSANVDEGAYQYVPRKLTATEGFDVDEGTVTPSVELASAPRLFPRHSTPCEALDPDAIRIVEVTKSSIGISIHGLSLKLRREEARVLLSLLEAAL
jgi:hypothetical protein